MPGFEVKGWMDVLFAQGGVQRYAAELGFSRRESQELAIVATELASNIIKYGHHGGLSAEAQVDEHGLYLQLEARDHGPPFHDLEAAMKDGWDQDGPIDPLKMFCRKGIGGGLGAIVRLSDSFSVRPESGGKLIVTRRYLHKRTASPRP
jgi:anti-sigma regulatory factor (Ser/Thr protein kinase)